MHKSISRRGLMPLMLATAARAAESDVGNLFPSLEWISGQNPRDLSFLDGRWKKLDAWKKAARPEFLSRLSYSPARAAGTAEVIHREPRDGFSIETVRLPATAAYQIPLRVLVPDNRSSRLPAVLVMHCHSGRYVWGHEKVLSSPGDAADLVEFRNQVYGRPFAEALVKRGFIVAFSDAFYFGERRLRVESMDAAAVPPMVQPQVRAIAQHAAGSAQWRGAVNAACSIYEHLTAKTIFSAGATWPGMLVWDDQRCLDYLASRPEADPKRLGCIGLSIGGLRTAHLAAADPRLRVACVIGWMTLFHEQLNRHLRNHTWMCYVSGLYPRMELADAAAMIAPGALLVQQCSRDQLFPMAGMKGSVERLTEIYKKAKLPERFRGTFYDVPHSFRPEMQEEAFAWIEKWI
ncbi:MAG: hypothetical protein FJW39_00875 [Acidobacteria bacterium]|nr:hypothetical protein [Acidobacteriota bacterium]